MTISDSQAGEMPIKLLSADAEDAAAALMQLFERITDPDVRQSILSLADSLVAASEGAAGLEQPT